MVTCIFKVCIILGAFAFVWGITVDSKAAESTSQARRTIGSTFSPLFGKKLIKSSSPKPSQIPELNFTPVPGGFYLTHKSVDVSGNATERPNYVSGLTSQTFSTYKDGKYSGGVFNNKLNTQTFYPSSQNAKNEIKQLHIQSTTPAIKTYTSVSPFSRQPTETSQHSENAAFNDFGFIKQKSIEKTNFSALDAQIISEVQKHAEQIIMKDLKNSPNAPSGFTKYSSVIPQLSTVTMQPIVVTDGGEISINNVVSSTPLPEVQKLNKNYGLGSINAVKLTEKSNDQVSGDSGFFRVSLPPSLISSINVSPTPQQLIGTKSSNSNLVSSVSNVCESNSCKKESSGGYSKTPGTKLEQLDPAVSDSKNNKITFYPKNEISAERHYVTTIDVQKGISLDVHQNEDGSIQLAQNFQFNKIRPYQTQNQYIAPTPAPLISNEISVTPNIFSTPQKPFVQNTVTVAPGLFDATSGQHLGVVQGYNEVLPNPAQDRIENRIVYESQLVPPAPPLTLIQNQASDDLRQVEKSIQDLRQKIISEIDAQHEEEQRKHGLVDEERRQYFENLQKVEALKGKSEVSYTLNVTPLSPIQATASPTALEDKSSIDVVTQTQYAQQAPVSYQAELKDYGNQVPVVYTNNQISPELYSKQVVTYNPQDYQSSEDSKPLGLFTPQNSANVYSQGQAIEYAKNYQSGFLTNSHALNVYPAAVPGYTTNSIQQTLPTYDDNNIQQTAPVYTAQKVEANNYPQIPPGSLQPRYTAPAITTEQKSAPFSTGVLQAQINVPVGVVAPLTNKISEATKTVLVNPVIPIDYSRLLQTSLLQYPVSIQAPSTLTVPALYQVPQTVAVPIQIPQTYKLTNYADVVENKHYHFGMRPRPVNKLRVQPLKPSTPNEDTQREAVVQNVLSQPHLYRTYYYPGVYNNGIHLRHVRKNHNSNSDQVPAQSLIRREKSLKNLRIEYGFKPPLRPSVEFSEEVKPSIYGSSVQPE